MHFKHIFRLTNISDLKISDILRREQNFEKICRYVLTLQRNLKYDWEIFKKIVPYS